MTTHRIELFGEEPGGRVVALVWQGSQRQMRSEDFRAGLNDLVRRIEEARPVGMLIDGRDFSYKPTVEDRSWRDSEVTPRYNGAGISKCAYVLAVIPENPSGYAGASFETRYFDNRDDADAWLLT